MKKLVMSLIAGRKFDTGFRRALSSDNPQNYANRANWGTSPFEFRKIPAARNIILAADSEILTRSGTLR
jgi:hypothetical protein